MAGDPVAELLETYKDFLETNVKILEALKQAELDRQTIEHLCERQEWSEKILNAIYLMLCEMLEQNRSLLEVLGKRLRKDSDKLNLLQEQLQERTLQNGLRDLLEVKAGGDVSIDQSRKVIDDEKSEG